MLESILPQIEFLKPYLSYLIITFFVWISYGYTLKCGAVSDDIEGIMNYDGKLQGPEYGMYWRWIRYHICGGNSPSKHKDPNGNAVVNGKVPSHHHFLSVILFNVTCIIAYQALSPYLGSKITLMAIIFLIVHPCTTQGVAWFSGMAYSLSLLWMSLIIILTRHFYLHPTISTAVWVIPVFILLQWLAIHAIFATTAMLWAILLFLGYWQVAILSFVVASAMCFDEIRKIVNLRVNEFKKQHMAQSTVLNWRKPIVALKTFFYYIRHAIAPIKMGLYHTWNFHYDDSTERIDWMFVAGLLSFCFLTCIFFNTNLIGIKLGILWFIVFSIGFWNIITAQQFVTERYIMVSTLGLGMVVATLTQNYLSVYTAIIAAYLVRTWLHLPTYANELDFYKSNTWNFPNSEVAYGNLGVTYARIGLPDSAKDCWLISSKINPNYDVPWVNIFYQFRTTGATLINNGDYIGGIKKLQEGLPYLEKAMNCKVCHFPDMWKKEHAELVNALKNPNIILQDELKRLLILRNNLRNELSRTMDTTRISQLVESVVNNDRQMDNLVDFFNKNGLKASDSNPFQVYYINKSMDKLRR